MSHFLYAQIEPQAHHYFRLTVCFSILFFFYLLYCQYANRNKLLCKFNYMFEVCILRIFVAIFLFCFFLTPHIFDCKTVQKSVFANCLLKKQNHARRMPISIQFCDNAAAAGLCQRPINCQLFALKKKDCKINWALIRWCCINSIAWSLDCIYTYDVEYKKKYYSLRGKKKL